MPPTIAPPDSQINVKLLKEGRRFERESVKKSSYRARCKDCIWEWQSENAAGDPKSAEDRASAHSTIERHRAEVVFDLLGVHYAAFHPSVTDEGTVR